MLGRLAYIRERLDTSIWLIPLGLCLLSAPLAVLTIWLDRTLPAGALWLGDFGLDVGAARQVLGVIAGSVISVGGVGFSVTMVALTLTSGQYGPKILRNFLEDKVSKISLGLFLGTFIYALIVLVGQPPEGKLQITVLTALVLSLASLIAFVHFIHRTATDLQADEIVHRIGGQLQDALDQMVEAVDPERRTYDTHGWRRAARGQKNLAVTATHQGYVQTVNYPQLQQWCATHDYRLLLRVRAGGFLIKGLEVGTLYGCSGDDAEAAIKAINDHIVTGPIRTPVQDPEHAITQLNQLAARALSPGINDPGTAITCIDWVSLALAHAVDKNMPCPVHLDEENKPRLLVRTHDFDGLLKAAYAPLRQYAAGNVAVQIRLLGSLCRLAELTSRRDRLQALAYHGELIWAGARTQALAADDLADIHRRYAVLTGMAARFDAS